MAPHRLRYITPLKAQAAEHTPPTFRFRVIAATPDLFIDFMLELLLAFIALVTAAGLLSGFSKSTVSSALPELVREGYAVLLIVGAVTILAGLRWRKYGSVLAHGLRLISAACFVYMVACLGYIGPADALVPIVRAGGFCILAAWRAFLLRSTYLLLESRRR